MHECTIKCLLLLVSRNRFITLESVRPQTLYVPPNGVGKPCVGRHRTGIYRTQSIPSFPYRNEPPPSVANPIGHCFHAENIAYVKPHSCSMR